MGHSGDVVLNQLTLVNGLIRRLLESQGIKSELESTQEIPFETKSKIQSMLKIQEKIYSKLSKQHQKQSNEKDLDLLIGNFHYYDKQYTKAISSYDKSLRADPKNIAGLINKGMAASKLGNHKEAISLYDRVLDISPKYFDAIYNKGLALIATEQYD